MDFNNDPTVTFADLQKLLQLVEERFQSGWRRTSANSSAHQIVAGDLRVKQKMD